MKKKMIYPPRILCGIMALLCWCSGTSAQGLIIGTGVHLVSAKAPDIVLANLSWTNNGSFAPDQSRVKFDLDPHFGVNFYLRGDSVTTFYHLLVNGRQGTLFNVQTDAWVIARFDAGGTMTSLGDADINLFPGAVVGGYEDGLFTGNNGRIITTVQLNKPQAVNPGNLGVEISSNEDLGFTTIVRGFREQINSAGEKSIERYYDIIPANQPSLPVSLRFRYRDTELNGNTRNRLAVFSGKPGSRLSMLPVTSNDGSNWVSAGKVSALQRFTLGNALATAQPAIEKLAMKAYPNPFRNSFTVTVYSEAAKPAELKMINHAGVVVERRIVQLQPGNNYIEWPAAGYIPGTYQLVIGAEAGKAIKVVKQ